MNYDVMIYALKVVRNHEFSGQIRMLSGTFSCDRSPPIYRHLVLSLFIKTLIIMSISTNIHKPYVCDPLGPYISLVNNSIDPITPYWSILINYPHLYID